MKPVTLRERLRYAFDSYMARGTIALIAGLFLISVALIVLIALFVTLSGAGVENGRPIPFGTLLWRNLLRTLDPGTMGDDQGPALFLASMLAVTIGGIFIVSTLIGVISSGLSNKLESLRRGRSRVIERDHTVILGWNQQVFAIITELAQANANRRRATVVVLANRDKVEMEEEIRGRVPDLRTTRVVCRHGSPIDLSDVQIANVQGSRAVIVVAPETDDPDADVIKTLLAITRDRGRRRDPYHIVAELRSARNRDVARMVAGDEVELVLAEELIARIIAQTCRQPGLSAVYNELLDFAGDEIYVVEEKSLVGKTFAEATLAYDDCTVIGLDNGTKHLHPEPGHRIAPDERIVCIAADDDRIHVGEPAAVDLSDPGEALVDDSRPERTLILGWNRMAPAVVAELDGYVAKGSEFLVVANVDASVFKSESLTSLDNHKAEFRCGDSSDRELLDELDVPSFDHVIVLCYTDTLEPQHADAVTLVTLLHLRDIKARAEATFTITSEVKDLRNRPLAEVSEADDFIVSDRLVSLVLAQVAESKAVNRVLADLFDAAGAEIYLKPVDRYVSVGTETTFADVVRACHRYKEVGLGYRLMADAQDADKHYGVRLNPSKREQVTFGDDDKMIVLAER